MERGREGQKGDRKKRGKDVLIGHSQAFDSFLHSDEEEKELIGLRDRMQGQGGEEKAWGGITKMLRGPYSHSHGAQRAVIKLHYQTG